MRVRGSAGLRLMVLAGVLVGAVVIGVLAANAPANNRDPIPTLAVLPGLEQMSYGENVAYRATLENVQNSMYTKVVFQQKVPTTTLGGDVLEAELLYASCAADPWSPGAPDAAGYFRCPELSQLPARQTATVVLVWRTPGLALQGDFVGCDGPGAGTPTNDCKLTTSGYWTMKEGTGNPGSSGPDTFPPLEGQVPYQTDLFGAAPDLSKARGYAVETCLDSSSLRTSASSGTKPVGPGNPLFTDVCAPTLPNELLDPGLLIQIDESQIGPDNKGLTNTISICIPSPGAECDGDGDTGQPWPFQPRATFFFVIDNTTMPPGKKVTKVFHDGVLTTSDPNVDCTITIINNKKITEVTCSSKFNGRWDFG